MLVRCNYQTLLMTKDHESMSRVRGLNASATRFMGIVRTLASQMCSNHASLRWCAPSWNLRYRLHCLCECGAKTQRRLWWNSWPSPVTPSLQSPSTATVDFNSWMFVAPNGPVQDDQLVIWVRWPKVSSDWNLKPPSKTLKLPPRVTDQVIA